MIYLKRWQCWVFKKLLLLNKYTKEKQRKLQKTKSTKDKNLQKKRVHTKDKSYKRKKYFTKDKIYKR